MQFESFVGLRNAERSKPLNLLLENTTLSIHKFASLQNVSIFMSISVQAIKKLVVKTWGLKLKKLDANDPDKHHFLLGIHDVIMCINK